MIKKKTVLTVSFILTTLFCVYEKKILVFHKIFQVLAASKISWETLNFSNNYTYLSILF